MTERAGVVVKLATPIRMLPTPECCRLISAHKKYPAQAELSQNRFKVSEIGDLRGDNDVQGPPLAKCITRSRLARCVKPYCLRPRCLMCDRLFVGTRRKSRAQGAIELRRSGRTVQGRKLRRQSQGQRTPSSQYKIGETGLPVLALGRSAPRPRFMVLRSKSATA
jgi:hypothetical protein